MSRALALTMPAVTLFSSPKGEPMAITHSPTFRRFTSPIFTKGRPVALDLHHRDVGALVEADDARLQFALVGQRHDHFVGAIDHVGVGHDEAVGTDA
jgi:hypothetical protein